MMNNTHIQNSLRRDRPLNCTYRFSGKIIHSIALLPCLRGLAPTEPDSETEKLQIVGAEGSSCRVGSGILRAAPGAIMVLQILPRAIVAACGIGATGGEAKAATS